MCGWLLSLAAPPSCVRVFDHRCRKDTFHDIITEHQPTARHVHWSPPLRHVHSPPGLCSGIARGIWRFGAGTVNIQWLFGQGLACPSFLFTENVQESMGKSQWSGLGTWFMRTLPGGRRNYTGIDPR